jgi:hypothetical protein
MMCFMLVFQRSLWARHQMPHRSFLLSTMALLFQPLLVCFASRCPTLALDKLWCSGRAYRHHQPPGRTYSSSRRDIHSFSSRRAVAQGGGELCYVGQVLLQAQEEEAGPAGA